MGQVNGGMCEVSVILGIAEFILRHRERGLIVMVLSTYIWATGVHELSLTGRWEKFESTARYELEELDVMPSITITWSGRF